MSKLPQLRTQPVSVCEYRSDIIVCLVYVFQKAISGKEDEQEKLFQTRNWVPRMCRIGSRMGDQACSGGMGTFWEACRKGLYSDYPQSQERKVGDLSVPTSLVSSRSKVPLLGGQHSGRPVSREGSVYLSQILQALLATQEARFHC